MVKTLGIIIISLLSLKGFSQDLSLGFGINAQWSHVGFRENLGFGVLDKNGDTLTLKVLDAKIEPIYSIPIYLRYNSKKNWWLQFDYSFESWRFDINGETQHTDSYLESRVLSKLEKSYFALNDTIVYGKPKDYVEAFGAIYKINETALNKLPFNSYEIVQYNKISLGFGSSFNNRGKVKFFYGGGINFIVTSTYESYQGLVYDDTDVKLQFKILEKLPKLEDSKLAPFVKIGIEKQNIRLGFDIQFYPNPTFSETDNVNTNWIIDKRFDNQTIRYALNYGLHLNYTIFNQNFGQKDIDGKGKVLDPKIIGKYKAKPKFFRFGISVNFPSFHNSGWNILEDFEIDEETDTLTHSLMNEKLNNANDNYLIGVYVDDEDVEDNLYLEKRINDIFINENGDIDTSVTYQTLFFAWGNLNTIIRSPKISGFVSINPHPLFSVDFNAGFQKLTIGIVAYESDRYSQGGENFITMRKLLYQENFNEISLGVNLNFHKQISNTSKIGLHIGANINTWMKGKFKIESGGVNDSELLQDFHQYFINGRNQSSWNRNIDSLANKGVFSKQDYLLHNYKPTSEIGQQRTYHSDFSNNLFDTRQKRRTIELRLGLDYYIDNFKFTIYGEKSLLNPNSLYNKLLTFGFGVSMYLN